MNTIDKLIVLIHVKFINNIEIRKPIIIFTILTDKRILIDCKNTFANEYFKYNLNSYFIVFPCGQLAVNEPPADRAK